MQPVDRLPFWPKIFDKSYTQAQAAPYREMTIPELYAYIGCDPHVPLPACTLEVRTKTSVESVTTETVRVTTYTAPSGILESTDHYDADSGSWHPFIFPVKRRGDIGVMRRSSRIADWSSTPRSSKPITR